MTLKNAMIYKCFHERKLTLYYVSTHDDQTIQPIKSFQNACVTTNEKFKKKSQKFYFGQ